MASSRANRKRPLYADLWVQVLVAVAVAIALGHFNPAKAIAMKPLDDAFIRVITMIISLIIFCDIARRFGRTVTIVERFAAGPSFKVN